MSYKERRNRNNYNLVILFEMLRWHVEMRRVRLRHVCQRSSGFGTRFTSAKCGALYRSWKNYLVIERLVETSRMYKKKRFFLLRYDKVEMWNVAVFVGGKEDKKRVHCIKQSPVDNELFTWEIPVPYIISLKKYIIYSKWNNTTGNMLFHFARKDTTTTSIIYNEPNFLYVSSKMFTK